MCECECVCVCVCVSQDLDIQSVEGLKGLGIAGESESDLACLSLDTVLAR